MSPALLLDATARAREIALALCANSGMREIRGKGVDVAREPSEEGCGRLTAIRLPGGGDLGLYEPPHRTPLRQ